VILYELVTGELPYNKDSGQLIIDDHLIADSDVSLVIRALLKRDTFARLSLDELIAKCRRI
jgi:hypothetical protein